MRLWLLIAVLFVWSSGCRKDSAPTNHPSPPPPETMSPEPLLSAIEALEGDRDPKCHATASRLEDVMYGTPLTAEARFFKNKQQRHLAASMWTSARDNKLPTPDCVPSALDRDHYASIAYSLRAILGAWLDSVVGLGPLVPVLDEPAIYRLAAHVDDQTLCALQRADSRARHDGHHRIDADLLGSVWPEIATTVAGPARRPPNLLSALVTLKVAAYAKYNDVSNQVFIRNIQVYFSKQRWPADTAEAKRFTDAFMETLIAFAADLYRSAEASATARGERLIREADVYRAAQSLAPHAVNALEDVVFFPELGPADRVVLEAYDLDAFRDSGVHWRYLGFALKDMGSAALLADPLAAELLTENIAQVGVLVLRLAGQLSSGNRLAATDLGKAVALMNQRRSQKPTPPSPVPMVKSSPSAGPTRAVFEDVTQLVGVDVTHRSSDWLNRLLRRVLAGRGAGNPTIPPAFGGSGLAARDVDGDGWEDLLLLSGKGNRLLKNVGGQRFEDVTVRAGLDWKRSSDRLPGEPRQPLVTDLDNDGDQDIIITYVDDPHRVYRNRGDGSFDDVTAQAGLGGAGLVGGPATLADLDGDGLLDLYIVYFGDYVRGVLPTLERRNTNGLGNRVFKNLGGCRFEDVTEGSGLNDRGWGQAVTHADLNADGKPDLVVGNDFGVNGYYLNQGRFRFREASAALGTDKPSYTMGLGLADLNDDLRPDLYVSNIVVMAKDDKYVSPNRDTQMKLNPATMARARVVEANDLFLSQADGTWIASDRVDRGYSGTGWSWGADFFDADNDGDDDLYVPNGMNEFRVYGEDNPYYADPSGTRRVGVFPSASAQTNLFFANEGGRLSNRSQGSGLDTLSNGRAFVPVDFDHDGDLDVVTIDYHGPVRVFRNGFDPKIKNWLQVELRGNTAAGKPSDAVGAQVVATVGTQRIWRQVTSSGGYLAVRPAALHFGLGSSTRADLEILWPNGDRQALAGVDGGQRVVVKKNAP